MKRVLKTVVSVTLSLAMVGAVACSGGSGETDNSYKAYDSSKRVEDTRSLTDQQYSVFNTVATDDLGRTFFTVDDVVDGERKVGMFFFLSLGQHDNHKGIYDVTKITNNDENRERFFVNDATSPVGSAHFWGEPVWGYYDSSDPFVVRRQIEMLTMSGVDFLVFDATNGITYQRVTNVILPILWEYYQKGWDVPQFMYYTAMIPNDGDAAQNKFEIKEIYDYVYKDGKYKDLWFCPYESGKPLIVKSELNHYAPGDEIGEFFEFRLRQWPVGDYFKDDGIPWIEFSYPQPLHSEWLNVSIAQHTGTRFSECENGNAGRGALWEPGGSYTNDRSRYIANSNYEQQWSTAHNTPEAKYIFVTGWNEWVGGKFEDASGVFMVDLFNAEFSRDIEPTRSGGLNDNCYLQTIRNIRTFNYAEAKHYEYDQKTIDISSDSAAWNDVQRYLDFTGDAVSRDYKMMAGLRKYQDFTNRNDIESIQVTHDSDYFYFRVKTVNDITEYEAGDTSWMNIWLNVPNNTGATLNGYHYVINRSVSNGTTQIMRCKGAEEFESVGTGDVRVYGNVMIVRIPRKVINMTGDNYNIAFKVTDHVTDIEYDFLNMYSAAGDCAPIGRLNYSYGY